MSTLLFFVMVNQKKPLVTRKKYSIFKNVVLLNYFLFHLNMRVRCSFSVLQEATGT